jgi:AraC-like DNA-binding protein
LGFDLHAGISQGEESTGLKDRHRDALAAAEKALSLRQGAVRGVDRPERSAERLRWLRRELAEGAGDRRDLLSLRFDRYIEAVLAHSAYHLETARAELVSGFERLAEPLLRRGALDRRSFNELCSASESSLEGVRTVSDLVAKYRSLVSDMAAAQKDATGARQERGTRRAAAYIREHLDEALSLAIVAKVAGFAPNYFSRLFQKDEGVTFAQYVQRQRLERAKQMLKSDILSIDEIRKVCGFRTRTHFHRAFRAAIKMTPAEYRVRG